MMALMEIAPVIKNVTHTTKNNSIVGSTPKVVDSKYFFFLSFFLVKCILHFDFNFSYCVPKEYCIVSEDCTGDSEVCVETDNGQQYIGKCVKLNYKHEKICK